MEDGTGLRVRPAPPPGPKRESLAQSAYAALKASILESLLPPGHEATEQAIADQLGMSRTPVHEAVLRLQHEGFLRVLPRRGVRVLPIDPTDLGETYDVLIALEGAAAALLAGRGGAAVEGMAAATEAMERAREAGDRKAWAAADDRFHRLLLEGCGNAKLAGLAQTMADQAQRARSATAALRADSGTSATEHAAILAALRAGRAEAARAAVAAHRRRASAEILRVLGAVPA
ncbi:GntR family transcriptional regulator [Paracraurococcus lichenis]|uniref:GntR family transcriptional regulator n=1 Tax=Paracraurococcus lichenis TaxID=3064888 RepID=A0ABT9DX39_9PROT|nr:GntR family transcriptional regulator [Paracraurococcus sp. LOR1-02]MDO9708360.1 GntR family transcriptional regulator [Paracraurococcus sp. LOR1-02]